MTDFPYNGICSDCTKDRGGIAPEGHTCTAMTTICRYCNKEKIVANIGDWNWPDGVERGGRD